MRSDEVRRTFLEFFVERGHQLVPSSPLVLPSDPTLLFANAGMNQFKEVFRGRETRPYRRATSSQKCLRVSGKHNDLEEVGRTPRHHTFFEMLGNFSFGDYFKEEATAWAWELITGPFGLPADRLWVTVFAGDEEFPADEEAAALWRDRVGVPAGRIVALGRKDNFWQMGDTGPAGPCSEILFDLHPERGAGDPASDPERFLELWNLVFMQYDLQPGGGSRPLPAPSIDTGAGLERLTAVLQGKSSNYDTDLFQPIIQSVAREAGVEYGTDPAKDVSLRVIADHLRAITMLVAEGVIPGPEKRGAVVRRIMRRALRHGRLLGLPAPFLHRHVASVVDVLGEPFPELKEALPVVERVTRAEEERFERTLADGFERLERAIEELLREGRRELSGEEAFVLESERGLPLDLIEDALQERGLGLDRRGYEEARRRHAERSRSRATGGEEEDPGRLPHLQPLAGRCRFVGYDTLRCEASRVLALFQDGKPVERLEAGSRGQAVLDTTPFYAESGGQVGDRGRLTGGAVRARVLDTRSPLPGVILHEVEVDAGVLDRGQILVAEVDPAHRAGARRHHTATHILHAALRRVLGTHVRQAGSLVAPGRLRFDFSHFEAVPPEAAEEIEALANEVVMQDLPVETEEMPLERALASGALAFFGDRYAEQVRVVGIGEFSRELCGGTHVARTGEIGPLLLLAERGVAAGVRRIEAVAGPEALARIRRDRATLAEATRRVGTSREELLEGLERKMEALRRLQREIDRLRLERAREGAAQGAEREVDGIRVIARRVDELTRAQRRDLADSLRHGGGRGAVVVVGAEEGGKAALVVAVTPSLAGRVDAREVVRRLGPIVGGGGGGRPDLAEAGGRRPDRIDEALARAPDAVREILGGAS
ncbi:MAG: alanine--tRNA ligase [Acidobacteria bacterium]|nr:MAG: alanine--tRNA ligase [Acidobacteriota bacterium]